MELIATFIPDPGKPRGSKHVAFLLPDAKTSFGRTLSFVSEEAMIAGLGKMGADVEELDQQVRSWSQGATHVFLSPAQVEWLKR